MDDDRAERIGSLAAPLAALAFYWWCLPPGVSWWDTAEAQTVPYVGGIFHPTGFPTYAMIGWLFSHAVAVGTIAWRLSLLSAVATAVCVWLLQRCARGLGCGPYHAALAALVFAAGEIVCEHATRAGVDAVAALLVVAAITCALEGRRAGAALFAGLALGAHPSTIWMLPGVALLALGSPQHRPDGPRLSSARPLAAFGLGLCAYAYLPIRSAMVTAQHLDPTATLALAYHPIWDYDHPQTVAGFIRLVSGADFGASRSLGLMLEPQRYASYLTTFFRTLSRQDTLAGVALAALGIAAPYRRPWIAAGLLVTAFGVFPFSVAYAGMIGQTDPAKYYLVALWVTALAIGIGAAILARVLARRAAPLRVCGIVALAGIAVLAALPSRAYLQQREDRSADGIIASVRQFTPEDAVIATPWWYATPLFYAAYAERTLGGRLIVTNLSHADIAALARSHRVYFFPIPSDDTAIDGALLTPIPGAWPALYRVSARPSSNGKANAIDLSLKK
jgi:hypothetical protein